MARTTPQGYRGTCKPLSYSCLEDDDGRCHTGWRLQSWRISPRGVGDICNKLKSPIKPHKCKLGTYHYTCWTNQFLDRASSSDANSEANVALRELMQNLHKAIIITVCFITKKIKILSKIMTRSTSHSASHIIHPVFVAV